MKITMAHGSGGQETSALIEQVFASRFQNPILAKMEDAAAVPGANRLALTTDSFVVTPLFFPGGDIGRLSVCGTVNDLLMSGATPKYLTCGFILEEGAELELLERIAASMADTAREAGVSVVAGDTKVVEGKGGVYINTAGVGFLPTDRELGARHCQQGDVLLLSGTLGDHHAAILSARMGIENEICSDCAPLCEGVAALFEAGVQVKAMRDVTRGGLATVLNEWARQSGHEIRLEEEALPVSKEVEAFCGILGLDPLTMGNEGKFVVAVAKQDESRAFAALRAARYCKHAAIIGRVEGPGEGAVRMNTRLGGVRRIPMLYGEGLPRIC